MKAIKNNILFLLIAIFLASCIHRHNRTSKINYPTATTESQTEQPPATDNSLLDQPSSKPQKQKLKVGILLPLSGKNKELGQSLLNAATMSLFENDANDDIELIVFDAKDNQFGATSAIGEAATKGIKIIIGPVFSNSVEAIADKIKSEKMIALSFSNNMDLANKNGIFLMGFMPEQQIEKIVSYSISQGRNNFSVIAPNNQYGLKVANIFKEVVQRKDGNFIISEFYLNNKELDKAAARVVNSFIVPERVSNKVNRKKGDIGLKEGDKVYSDTILIPESGATLFKIVDYIKKSNVNERDFQFIGTSQWDEIATLNDPNLVGSWFPAPDFHEYKNFEKKYYKTYGKFPVRISSIAYDAMGAIINLVNQTGNKNLTTDDFINYSSPKNGFEGIDGLFRFLPNGLVQRNLAILEVDNAEFKIADSPSIFLKY